MPFELGCEMLRIFESTNRPRPSSRRKDYSRAGTPAAVGGAGSPRDLIRTVCNNVLEYKAIFLYSKIYLEQNNTVIMYIPRCGRSTSHPTDLSRVEMDHCQAHATKGKPPAPSSSAPRTHCCGCAFCRGCDGRSCCRKFATPA
jgi:hypothetical protein